MKALINHNLNTADVNVAKEKVEGEDEIEECLVDARVLCAMRAQAYASTKTAPIFLLLVDRIGQFIGLAWGAEMYRSQVYSLGACPCVFERVDHRVTYHISFLRMCRCRLLVIEQFYRSKNRHLPREVGTPFTEARRVPSSKSRPRVLPRRRTFVVLPWEHGG